MKIFLDDIRETPIGWVRCYWPNEVINLLLTNNISHISLDHDLGDDVRGTGYDVLNWLEEKLYYDPTFQCPKIFIHSDNSSARLKMEAAIKSIYRKKLYHNKNQ